MSARTQNLRTEEQSRSGESFDTDDSVRVNGVFYKYREFPRDDDSAARERIEAMLLRQEIYFASPATLNDPFDCYPRIELDDDRTIVRMKASDLLAEVLAAKGARITPAYRRTREFQTALSDLMKDLTNARFRNEQLYKAIDSKTGVYCMSRRNDSVLQWSYYAGGHTGFCLEFTIPDKASPPFDQVVAMEYVPDRKSIDLFDVISEGHKRFVWQLVRRKFSDWEHECEVRAFMPMAGVMTYSPHALTGVVFGIKTTETNKQWVRSLVSKSGLKVRYYQAAQSFTHFAIDVSTV